MRIRRTSRSARRSSAFSIWRRTSALTAEGGSTRILLTTLFTPVRFRTTRSASSRSLQRSTIPSRITQPSDTVDVILSSGTNTSHSSAWRTARAISVSLRISPPVVLIFTSLATSRTPLTRLTASSVATRFAQLVTVPVSVTTPSSTSTPISVSSTRGSHLSSSSTSWWVWVSAFFIHAPIVSSGRQHDCEALPRDGGPRLRLPMTIRPDDHHNFGRDVLVGCLEDIEIIVGAQRYVIRNPLHLGTFFANMISDFSLQSS